MLTNNDKLGRWVNGTVGKIERIEKCKEFYGNTYNHKYDGYLFVHDNGDFILPNYFIIFVF